MDTRQLISKSIDNLQLIFGSYLENVFESKYGKNWEIFCEEMDEDMKEKIIYNKKNNKFNKDLNFYLNLLIRFYNKLNFNTKYVYTIAYYIKNIRNKWAHNYNFSEREAYRVIDIFQSFLEELNLDTHDLNANRLEALDTLNEIEFKSKRLNNQKNISAKNEVIKVNSIYNNKDYYDYSTVSPNHINKPVEENINLFPKTTPRSNNDLITMNKIYLSNSNVNSTSNNRMYDKKNSKGNFNNIHIYKDYKLRELDDVMDEDRNYFKQEEINQLNSFPKNTNFYNNFENNISKSIIISEPQNNYSGKPSNYKLNNNFNFNYELDNPKDKNYF